MAAFLGSLEIKVAIRAALVNDARAVFAGRVMCMPSNDWKRDVRVRQPHPASYLAVHDPAA